MEGKEPVPKFIRKTYEMVNDESTDHIVSWSPSGTSFVIWNRAELYEHVLPLFFKHKNFCSFNRLLSKYGFCKVDKSKSEYANSNFVRGQPELMQNIRKCPKSFSLPSTEAKQLREEAKKLRKEKRVLQIKIEKLKVENKSMEEEIQRLKMNPEDIKSEEKNQRKKKCLGKDESFGKKSNSFEDIIKGKAKLPEIDLNSLPESDVLEDPMDSRSSGFKDPSQ